MRQNYYCSLLLIVCCLLSIGLSLGQTTTYSPATKVFSFSLSASARTSAGVFTSAGTLVRTLWSNQTLPAGTYSRTWDGRDDEGRQAADATYQIRVLSNNVAYEWEGVLGNSSFRPNAGNTIHRGYQHIRGMVQVGQFMYFCQHYAEGPPSPAKFNVNTPQEKIEITPRGTGLAVEHICSDGTNVYFGGFDFDRSAESPNTGVYAVRAQTDKLVTFPNGSAYKPYHHDSTFSLINYRSDKSWISGMAVQKTGNFLFIAYRTKNRIDVCDKTTGRLLKSLSFNAPRQLTIDNTNLWVVSSTNQVQKFAILADTTLSAANAPLQGLQNPLAMTLSSDGSRIVVCDAGSSQQVKAFTAADGIPDWTLGQPGGYATTATVTNDRFYFSDASEGITDSFVTFQTDGSLWVGDAGNYRCQHFSASRQFIDNIAYIQNSYVSAVDQNNSSRVFDQYLEYAIDYTKPLMPGNGSWTLVKNWRAAVPKEFFFTNPTQTFSSQQPYKEANMFGVFTTLATLSNGRTYSFVKRETDQKQVLVELQATGQLRVTSLVFDRVVQLGTDGGLYSANYDGTGTWKKQTLTGFDAVNNPVWSAPLAIANVPITQRDPTDATGFGSSSAHLKTSTNLLLQFDGSLPRNGYGYGAHLGAVAEGTTSWKWKTAYATSGPGYRGIYPLDGAFDIGNHANFVEGQQNGYAGGGVTATGRHVFWNYYGEFWKDAQTNYWQHIYDNGLSLGLFGTDAIKANRQIGYPGMAGGVHFGHAVQVGDAIYIYHAEEGGFSGLHRWKVTGLNTIQEQTISVPFATSSVHGLLGQYMSSADLNNLNLKTTRVDATVAFNWQGNAPTNTAITNSDNFSVRWTGYVQPLYAESYTFSVRSDDGVRLWVDGKLLIDSWQSQPITERSGSITLSADQKYTIRLEYYDQSDEAAVSLSWSSPSQAKQVIPTAQLYPAEAPSINEGKDLLEGLQATQMLKDNLYGWRRNPTTENLTGNPYFSARTSVRTYDRFSSPDLYMQFNGNSTTSQVNRDLGTGDPVSFWKIVGQLNQADNFFNIDEGAGRRGGSSLEVVDVDGKVIAQLYSQVFFDQPNSPSRVVGNRQVITSGEYFGTVGPVYGQSQPVDISANDGTITIQYGPYPPVTATTFDPSGNWRRPKTLRFNFWDDGKSFTRVMDIERLRYITVSASGAREAVAERDSVIIVYPNPAKDELQVSHPAVTEKAVLSILSVTGQSVQTREIVSGSTSTTLSVGPLASGPYLLRYQTSSSSRTIRFIKQ